MTIYPGLRGEIGSHLRIFNAPQLLKNELYRLLTFKNPDYYTALRYSPWATTHVSPEVCLALDFDTYVQLPRGFNAVGTLSSKAYAIWQKIKWEDYRTSFPVTFPKIKITPNADQEKLAKAFLKAEKDGKRPFGANLLIAPTSSGKTIAQGYLAALVGEKTLVLCKTNLIKRAWLHDMKLMFGFSEKDLGVIQQDKYRLGEHITLASIATMTRRKHLWTEIFSHVGCLILDETQVIGAETIKEIVENCPARYVIGMTATPTRRDGKTFIVNSYMGDPLVRILNKQVETETSYPLADAKLVQTRFRFDDEKGRAIDHEDLDHNKLYDAMMHDEERNQLLINEVRADYDAGHSVLISTPRVQHVAMLADMLTKAGIPAGVLTGTTISKKRYSEALIQDVISRKCRCLVASTQAIKLGANLNPLDRLHVFIPPLNTEDLEQIIGRIRRKHPSKKDAQLRYYWDLEVPYLNRKYKTVFMSVMRKLRVKRFENVFIA